MVRYSYWQTFVSIIVALFSLILSIDQALSEETNKQLYDCGPESLFLVCQHQGVNTNIEDIVKLSGTDQEGTTMLALFRTAKSLGLEAAGVKMSLSELKKLSIPAVALLSDFHYVALWFDKDEMIVTDPSTNKPIEFHDLQSQYSGYALLLSRDKIALPNQNNDGPDLRVDNMQYLFGEITAGEKITASINIKNSGNKTLLIDSIRPSCPCLELQLLEKEIPPQQTETLTVSLDTLGMSGKTSYYIYIHSNDQISPLTVLSIEGYIINKGLNLSYQTINFGTLKHGNQYTKTEIIEHRTDDNLRVLAIYFEPSYFEYEVSEEIYGTKKLTIIHVKNMNDIPLGNTLATLNILTNLKEGSLVKIPLKIEVVGDIKLSQSKVYLTNRYPGGLKANLELTNISGMPVDITSIESTQQYIKTSIDYKDDKKKMVCSIFIDDAPKGFHEDWIVIKTKNPLQNVIVIQVYIEII